jgi:hypothetical protein
MQVLLAIEEAALQAILSVWLSMDSNATPAAATEPAAATKLAEGGGTFHIYTRQHSFV